MIDELVIKANNALIRSNEAFRMARDRRMYLEEAEKEAKSRQEFYRQQLLILKDALAKEPWV